MFLVDLVVDRQFDVHLAGNGKTDFCLTDFCLGFVAWWFVYLQCQVIDPRFDPGLKSAFSSGLC